MQTNPLDQLVERLGELLAKATPTPWAYRPDELDDWGFIRGPDIKPGWRSTVAQARAGHKAQFYDAGWHRKNGTDPFEDNGILIVEAVNALPELLAALLSQQETIARLSWQPIESAPKDGTWFVALQDGETYPCEWRAEDQDEGPPREGWFDHFNQSFEEPTRWREAQEQARSTLSPIRRETE